MTTHIPYEPPERQYADTMLAFKDFELASTWSVCIDPDPLGPVNKIVTLMRGRRRVRSVLCPVPVGASVRLVRDEGAWTLRNVFALRDRLWDSRGSGEPEPSIDIRPPGWRVEVNERTVLTVTDAEMHPPRFCSLACRAIAYRGDGNPKWRGGTYISSSGYRYIHTPDHPNANNYGYVPEHRLVMERHLGRVLDPTECVHHFNHNRLDNRIENLELMASWADHQRRHGYYQPFKCGNCGETVMRTRGQRGRFPKNSYCSRKCAAAGASRANAEAARSGNRKPPKRIERST